MKRSGTRRPWLTRNNLNGALKVRNINVNYSALSELHDHCARLPGATRLTLFGACPWLSYFAPSALPHSRCPWLSYFAPSALPHSRCPCLSYSAPSGAAALSLPLAIYISRLRRACGVRRCRSSLVRAVEIALRQQRRRGSSEAGNQSRHSGDDNLIVILF